MSERGPIFLAGVDRSGIGFLCELLECHPAIAMTRRTNFWSYYHNRFGNLSRPDNFSRCLSEMMRNRRMRILEPLPEDLRRQFEQGAPTYARLFALLQENRARRLGKTRWGDKSLQSEGHADTILAAYPTAKMIHVIRDPRDRYASGATHRGESGGKLGAGTAIWLWSAALARRNLAAYPGRYHVIRYEDLAEHPEATLRDICGFLAEPYSPRVLMIGGGDGASATGKPAGRFEPRDIRTTSLGRFRRDLSRREVAFIQALAGDEMIRYGYELEPIRLSWPDRALFAIADWPLNRARMLGSRALALVRDHVGRTPSSRRLVQSP